MIVSSGQQGACKLLLLRRGSSEWLDGQKLSVERDHCTRITLGVFYLLNVHPKVDSTDDAVTKEREPSTWFRTSTSSRRSGRS